jgi:hypothetical protein
MVTCISCGSSTVPGMAGHYSGAGRWLCASCMLQEKTAKLVENQNRILEEQNRILSQSNAARLKSRSFYNTSSARGASSQSPEANKTFPIHSDNLQKNKIKWEELGTFLIWSPFLIPYLYLCACAFWWFVKFILWIAVWGFWWGSIPTWQWLIFNPVELLHSISK